MKQECEVHLQVLEGVICRFGYRVGLQYNLSSMDRWIDKKGQQDTRGYDEDVCHAPIEEMGGVLSIS